MKRRIFTILLAFSLLFLAGCSKETPKISVTQTIDTLYAEILDPYSEGWLTSFNAEQIISKFGISLTLYREQRVYASEKSSRCSVIAGFEAEEGNFDELVTALENAQKKATSDFNGYLPDQYKIAEESVLIKAEPYCFLVMTDRNEKITQALDEVLAGNNN